MSTVAGMMAGGLPQITAQTVAGEYSALAATGTTQATAASVKNTIHSLTGAGDTGVILPLATVGDEFTLANISGNTIKVYPPVGGALNGGTANDAISVATAKVATCKAYTNLNYAVTVGA